MISAFAPKRILPAIAILAALAFGLSVQSARGQGITTGSIAGAIADPQGALVPQAKISALQVASGALFQGASESDGEFALHDLPIGIYTLTVESGSFLPLKITNVLVNAGVTTHLGTQKLALGATSTVTV